MKRKFLKQGFAYLLTSAMVVSAVPVTSLQASAAELELQVEEGTKQEEQALDAQDEESIPQAEEKGESELSIEEGDLSARELSAEETKNLTATQEAAAEVSEPVRKSGKNQIVKLQTEGKENPLGIDAKAPVFSWQMKSDGIGVQQESYQIIVKRAADGTTVWDSGKVASGTSTEVIYSGKALEACTAYNWYVDVTDNFGTTVRSETATFETALMSTDLSAWDGAEWIGADELSLDAAGSTTFDITTKMQIPAGSTSASIIFGADDFRLNKDIYNVEGMQGENYFRVEFDTSKVTKDGGAAVNIYRVGYFKKDSEKTPFKVISKKEIPDTNLDELITEANKNGTFDLEMSVNTSTLNIFINGEKVVTGEKSTGDIVLSDYGSSNSMTFPNLNSIGFAAKAGEKAVFTDFELQNPCYGTGTLFGADTGAAYSIWDGKQGISIAKNKITVDGGADGTLVYADPSYGSEPYLRTGFSTKAGKKIAFARLYITCQGIYNFYINGKEVAEEEWFNPGSTEYREEIGYNTYDVTDYLVNGKNAMGGVLGEGWWCGHATYDENNYNYYGDKEALLVKLDITYEDGEKDTIVTDDATWDYFGDGPVRFASFFEGERYDATKEDGVEGYATADYNDSAWRDAAVIETRAPFQDQKLITRTDDPVHVINTLAAKGLGEIKAGSGSYIYDLGENVAAVPEITIPKEYADEGTEIAVRVAEILYPDNEEYIENGLAGNLLQENYRAALTTDFYIMGDEDAVFVPDLTFHGYRYLEISGLKKELPAEYVKSLVLSSIDCTAAYESSNELTNRLFQNVLNSQASNYLSLPTDCPQRNERMGWTGDAQVFALAGSYNSNTYEFLRQWLSCIRASQGADGMTPHTAPNYPSYSEGAKIVTPKGTSFGITWNCAIVTIAYYLYEQYGDATIIQENIDAIYKYMENLEGKPLSYTDRNGAKQTEAALTSQTGFLCDHLSIASTDGTMLGNAVYVYCLKNTAEMAAAIGDQDQAEKYQDMYEAAKNAWNVLYLDEATGKTCTPDGKLIHTQASYATPINFGVINEENLDQVLDQYIDTIEKPAAIDGASVTPYTITTGFNATPNVLNALSKHGRSDIAYKMFESTDYASWLYPVTQGATSIWERWNSYTVENGFGGNNSMNSFNHYSLGAVSSWMMDTQLGIQYDSQHPGYKNFILQPTAGGTFTYVKGSFASAYGQIYSGWTADGGKMSTYMATVPANTTATLYLPMNENQAECLVVPDGAVYRGMEEHNGVTCAKIELVSGDYEFEILSESEAALEAAKKMQEKADQAQAEAEKAMQEAKEAKEAADKAMQEANEMKNSSQAAQAAAEKRAKEAEKIAAQALEAANKAQAAYEKAAFNVKKPALKKAKSSRSRYAKLTWKKVSGANGYVIQYAANASFKKAKTTTVKKGSITAKVFKKLKKGKKYYFRIRAYKVMDGKKIYTQYSNKKSVKVK